MDVNCRYQELMQTDGYVTATKLKNAYLGIEVKQETLLKLFEQHNAEFEKKVGYSRAQGNFARYRIVCKHIREFLSSTYHWEDIPLKELSLTFINDFEYFLREEKKYRMGIYDCIEAYHFNCSKYRLIAVQSFCRIYQQSRKRR